MIKPNRFYLVIAIVILVVTLIIIINALNYQSVKLHIPDSDIIFSVVETNAQQWGFATITSGNIDYLSPIEPDWEFPTPLPNSNGILFRVGLPPLSGPLYDLGPSGTGVGEWTTGNDIHLCEESFLRGRPRWNNEYEGVILVTEDFQGVISFDPFVCSQVQILYHIPENSEQLLAGQDISKVAIVDPVISENGLLAFSTFSPCCEANLSPGAVFIVDLETSEIRQIIEAATNPVWSSDGSQLSYIGLDGIYITDRFGVNRTKLVDYDAASTSNVPGGESWYWRSWLPFAEWSPDGKELTYHRLIEERPSGTWSIFSIFIYDIALQREQLIVENGMNPYWIPVKA